MRPFPAGFALVLLVVACGEPKPSRVDGTLDVLVGGVTSTVQASFASLSPGGVAYDAEPNGKLATAILPVSSIAGSPGTKTPIVGLGFEVLPPMLLWSGTESFSDVIIALQDETLFRKGEETDATLTFDSFEVTEDPHMPFIARGKVAGRVVNGSDTMSFLETTFSLAADCSPEGTQDPHLCGEPVLYAQFYGMGTDQTDCPIELVRHFIGSSVNVLVKDVVEPKGKVLTIGDVGAPFTCIPTERTPKDPEKPRLICHAAAEGLVHDGCTWNAWAVATPTARYITISARAVGECAKPTCNAIKF